MFEKSAIIITAGGSGLRMNAKIKKQYIEICGYPILYYALKSFSEIGFQENILVVPKNDFNYVKTNIINKFGFENFILTSGGASRHHSVYNGLKKIRDSKYVLIHDGVRPLTEKKIIIDVLTGLFKKNIQGIIPAVKLKDTIKQVKNGAIVSTLNREELVAVQTPQGFNFKILFDCYKKSLKFLDKFTDDASILERYGYEVKTVEGDYSNIKITTNDDIFFAEHLLRSKTVLEN
ncbi:MAG TPA: 2-C-methyl-D-erythritol 4-phosphate cytidylyltransferase [bacterium]|nr:2-C-methyl-D-erythritol 4-phosphate cytidylyltransferase [bacterium]